MKPLPTEEEEELGPLVALEEVAGVRTVGRRSHCCRRSRWSSLELGGEPWRRSLDRWRCWKKSPELGPLADEVVGCRWSLEEKLGGGAWMRTRRSLEEEEEEEEEEELELSGSGGNT
ncbi:uncharacterized protein A4U43_C10F13420 [Asparagus officinalis]|uniref:Uncharacterized protein n=1 Tax=Asparagus officinalis TaxID=4686 RepID=A0A5P1E749_ASPOF|nr:uncharacterized protein A4U43_C10F13420 [Asparagus officinalis]